MQDAMNLPSGHRVKVEWDDLTKLPVGQGGQLYSRFVGGVGQNYQRFPIDALDWRKIDANSKKFAFDEIVKVC